MHVMKKQSTSPNRTRPQTAQQREIISLAIERVKQGLSPPAEIYRVDYRDRIDWSQFPSWARCSNPDMFDGSCHEG